MAQRDVCLENLRFTQNSIRKTFKRPYEYQCIEDAVVQIGNNQLSPAVLMPLTVVHHKSVLWSLDNRRLWVLRKAGVPTVKVVLVPTNYNRRSEDFFSSLSDPHLEKRYSSANYFPRVRKGVRSVGTNRGNVGSGGAPHPPISPPLHYPIAVAGPTQANRTPPHLLRDITVRSNIPPVVSSLPNAPRQTSNNNFHTISIPLPLHYPIAVAGGAQANRTPPRLLRDITVRSNIPPVVSPLPNAPRQTSNNNVHTISNNNSGPGGNQGSDSLWEKILNVMNCVIYKGFGFFGFIPPRSFNLSTKKVVRLGKFAFIVLGFCFVLRQVYNPDKGGVNSNLTSRETITVIEDGLENIFRVGNGGGSCENVVSDQNSNHMRVSGYLRIVAVKGVVGMVKMVSYLLSKMFRFLRFVVWNVVGLSKGVVVSLGRKTSDTCGVILSQCFGRLQFITCQVAVRLGRMGIRVSVLCLEKIRELLRFIECQAFRLVGKMVAWSLKKMKDALSFFR